MENLMHTDQVFDSAMSRKEVRKMAIQEMKRIGYAVMIAKSGKFAKKYASSAPYHLFFTRVENSQETHNQQFSITFSEILDHSLGEIVNSLHLTFMVDVKWLYLQYLLAGQRTNMTILCKHRTYHEELNENVIIIKVEGQRDQFSSHHANIMILQYKDGIRVIVSTAGLYSVDWENRTQGSVKYAYRYFFIEICFYLYLFIMSLLDCGSRLICLTCQNPQSLVMGNLQRVLKRISSDI